MIEDDDELTDDTLLPGDERRSCIDCHADFILTAGEICFLRDEGLQLRKRCKACVALKRERDRARGVAVGGWR